MIEILRPSDDVYVGSNFSKYPPNTAFYFQTVVDESGQDADATYISFDFDLIQNDYVEDHIEFALSDPSINDENAKINSVKVKMYIRATESIGSSTYLLARCYLVYGDFSSYADIGQITDEYQLKEIEFTHIGGLPITLEMLRNTNVKLYFYVAKRDYLEGGGGVYYPQPPQGVPA